MTEARQRLTAVWWPWHHRLMGFRFGEFQLDDERFTLVGPVGPIHVEP